MGWLREQLNDPNVHGILAIVTGVASKVPAMAPWAMLLEGITGALMATTVALPEKPAKPARKR